MSRKQIHKASLLHSTSDRLKPSVGAVPTWARDTSNSRAVVGRAVEGVSLPAFDQTALFSSSMLTIANVAALLQVSPKTVRRLIDRGELGAIRIGRSVRIKPEILRALIERGAR